MLYIVLADTAVTEWEAALDDHEALAKVAKDEVPVNWAFSQSIIVAPVDL